MPTLFVDITFAVISNGARSGTIHETVEMSEELYDAFVHDTTTSRGGYNLANWIKNNLAYKVIPLGYNHWEVVSPTVRRSNKEMPKARVVSLDRQSNQKKSGIQTFDKPKVNYFAKILGIILTIITLVIIVEVARGESPEVPMWFKIGLILVLMSITVSVNKSANGEE